MEPKQISRGSVCDRFPPLSAKYPWFVAENVEENGEQIFYTIDKPWSHYRCRVPELIGRQIRAYFHGWAILSNHMSCHSDDDMWFLWNPLTRKLIRLPRQLICKNYIYSPGCCLSAPPDDPSSIFLLTMHGEPIFVFCRLDRKRKRSRWTKMSYAKQLRSVSGGEDGFLGSPACCNGKVYAMTFKTRCAFVMQVDIVVKDKEVVISLSPFVKVVDVCLDRCPSFYNLRFVCDYLRGTTTELFHVVLGFTDETRKTISDLYLLKLDMDSRTWDKMEDLKDAMFFLEPSSDYSIFYTRSAVSSELGGYIHILSETGKIVYSYHVKDRTISQSSMPSVVRESQVSVWALLEFWLEDDQASSSKQEKEDDSEIVVRSEIVSSHSMKGESVIDNIPFHILEKIMELCVGVEYLNFRATCKHCCLAAPPIKWRESKTRLQEYSLFSPWLIVFDNNRCVFTFIDPLCGDKYFIKAPQQLRDYQIYCSRYGWLLMYKVLGQLAFFNPFTGDIHQLPVVGGLDTFCFSTPPTSPDCMVVGFVKGDLNIFIHSVAGEQDWDTLSLDFGDVDPYSFHFPTFYGQEIYALCNGGVFTIFREMGGEDFSWEEKISRASSSPAEYYLAICDQHRLLVIVAEFGESVEVFNLINNNDDEEELEKIDDIGNHMIFVSSTTCLCVEAKSPEMKNKIYFSRLHSVNGEIVFYSLDTRKYHTLNGKESYEDLLNTKHHCYPHTWIEPNWS